MEHRLLRISEFLLDVGRNIMAGGECVVYLQMRQELAKENRRNNCLRDLSDGHKYPGRAILGRRLM